MAQSTPIGRRHLAASQALHAEQLAAGLTRYTFGLTNPVYRRILMVDDDRCDVELSLEGFWMGGLTSEVVVAADGAIALTHLQGQAHAESLPDLALLDIKMPKLGGLDLLAAIRSDPRLAALRVVMLTGSAVAEDIDRAESLGCDDYIVKPVGLICFMYAVAAIGSAQRPAAPRRGLGAHRATMTLGSFDIR